MPFVIYLCCFCSSFSPLFLYSFLLDAALILPLPFIHISSLSQTLIVFCLDNCINIFSLHDFILLLSTLIHLPVKWEPTNLNFTLQVTVSQTEIQRHNLIAPNILWEFFFNLWLYPINSLENLNDNLIIELCFPIAVPEFVFLSPINSVLFSV